MRGLLVWFVAFEGGLLLCSQHSEANQWSPDQMLGVISELDREISQLRGMERRRRGYPFIRLGRAPSARFPARLARAAPTNRPFTGHTTQTLWRFMRLG